MGKHRLHKLTIVIVWVVIAACLYQCSVLSSTEKNPEYTYEESKAEENSEKPKKHETIPERQIPGEMIRVLIKTSDFSAIYHDELIFSSESGMYIEQDKKIKTYAPSEELKITKLDFQDKQICIKPYENGQIKVHNVTRVQEVRYRGSMECFGTQDGIVLVNELPVEEYLYGVVPSEMPAVYPEEALKAQAISARTYTYFHRKSFAYPEWAAHVDDSTTFQVYKNISENENVNRAVDATKNLVMMYQGEVIESFYYSTSSGRSAGYEVWKPGETKGWLQGKKMAATEQALIQGKSLTAAEQDSVQTEDFSYNSKETSEVVRDRENAYRTYITLGNVNDAECQEPWYRWEYTRSIEAKELLKRIESLQSKYPDEISIRSKYKKGKKLTQESEILSCRVRQREKSGMVQQLYIQTKNFEIIIKTQQCIREVLARNGDVIRKNDGSEFTLGELLPSAYFYFDALYEDNGLKSMTIHGGGFGHGAGMSQNGAKCLAKLGLAASDILKYYYNEIEIKDVTQL